MSVGSDILPKLNFSADLMTVVVLLPYVRESQKIPKALSLAESFETPRTV